MQTVFSPPLATRPQEPQGKTKCTCFQGLRKGRQQRVAVAMEQRYNMDGATVTTRPTALNRFKALFSSRSAQLQDGERGDFQGGALEVQQSYKTQTQGGYTATGQEGVIAQTRTGCLCFGGASKMVNEQSMQGAQSLQGGYSETGAASGNVSSKSKCPCFGGTSKMLNSQGNQAHAYAGGGVAFTASAQGTYNQSLPTQNAAKPRGKCSCFGGSSKMLGARAAAGSYAQSDAKQKGTCFCFGGSSKMSGSGGAGTSAAGAQYAVTTQEQYSQGCAQDSPKCGGKCSSCFGGSSKMLGTGAVDAQRAQTYGQTQADMQAKTKSRSKCPCFGGSAKMIVAGGGVKEAAVVGTQAPALLPSVQGNTATYEIVQPYEVQQVASGPVTQAPVTQVLYESPQPQGNVLIATQELHAPISLADELQPVAQTVPTTYTMVPPLAIVSVPPPMAASQLPQAAAVVPTATYVSKPASTTYVAQAPARTQYSATQVTSSTIVSQGRVSPVSPAKVHSPIGQSTASSFTYTSTAPAQLSQLSSMSVQTPASAGPTQLSPMAVQAPTYTTGSVTSTPYRQGSGQSSLVQMGSAMTRPGQVMREPTVGGPAVYLGQPGSSAVVSAAGAPASSAYVPASTLPLRTVGSPSLMSQEGGRGMGTWVQTNDGSSAQFARTVGQH